MSAGSLKVISSIIFSLSVVSIGGPVLGELLATKAPIFPKQAALSAKHLGIPYEEVSFPAVDGPILRGWFFPVEKRGAPAIIYAPATARDQRSGMSLVEPLHEAGFHVLLFSYRGHGLSEGSPFGFTYGAMESMDVDAAVRFLYETKGIHRIGAIGHSAGAVSILLSASRNSHIGAIVAASAFPTMEDVWRTNSPAIMPIPFIELMMRISELARGYTRQQIRPQDVIGQISPRPLLLIHGSGDRRITFDQAIRMFEAAEEPKRLWLIEGADHGQVRTPVMDDIIQEIIAFLAEALRSPADEEGQCISGGNHAARSPAN